jgi:thioredoxin-related protein
LYLEYKKKDVVFISISIDDSLDAWKKMLGKENPEWLQLHMEKGKSNLLDAYLISTIPRFILIDKEGKIINAQAPAASGDIRKLLNNTKSAS